MAIYVFFFQAEDGIRDTSVTGVQTCALPITIPARISDNEGTVIRFEKFTVKAQEAMQAAQSLADQHNHQSMEPEHLLLALLQQREGVVGPVLAKLGARPEVIQRALEQALERLPTVRGGGGQHYLGERLRAALERAQAEAERLKDEYVSTEH